MLISIEPNIGRAEMITRLSARFVSVVVLLTPIQVIAQETRSRSILVFDQSDMRGPLSSSIAHELNQPLGTILTNAETAERILNSPSPDLSEIKEILADIRRDDLRASEVIRRMRRLLMRVPFEAKNIDINDTMREVFAFLSIQA